MQQQSSFINHCQAKVVNKMLKSIIFVPYKTKKRKGCLPWVMRIIPFTERDNPYRGKSPISLMQRDYLSDSKELSFTKQPLL